MKEKMNLIEATILALQGRLQEDIRASRRLVENKEVRTVEIKNEGRLSKDGRDIKTEGKSSGIFEQADVDSYLEDVAGVVSDIIVGQSDAEIGIPGNGMLENNNNVIYYELPIIRQNGADLVGISDAIADRLYDKIGSGKVQQIQCSPLHKPNRQVLVIAIIGPDIVNEGKKVENVYSISFEEKLDGLFSEIEPEEEFGGYRINNTPLCISDGAVDDNGELVEGVCFYTTSIYLIPSVRGGELNIRAPFTVKDENGVEYGDSLAFFGEFDDIDIVGIYDELRTEIKMVDAMDVQDKLEEACKKDTKNDFDTYKKYILDNVYCDEDTYLTTPEIIKEYANMIAEESAEQIMAEVSDEQEDTNFYKATKDDYEKVIKEVILTHINEIVKAHNDDINDPSKYWGSSRKVEEDKDAISFVELVDNIKKLGLWDGKDETFKDAVSKYYSIMDTDRKLRAESFNKELDDMENEWGMDWAQNLPDIYRDFVDNFIIDLSDEELESISVEDIIEEYKDSMYSDEDELEEFEEEIYNSAFDSYAKYSIKKAQEKRGTAENFNEALKVKNEKKSLTEGARQRLEERNEQSANTIEQALAQLTSDTDEVQVGIVTKTSELFQQLSDRGYDVQVSFDNGESTSVIAIGQQGANILITITDPEQPLRAFASGNFELNDDSIKMIKSVLEVL